MTTSTYIRAAATLAGNCTDKRLLESRDKLQTRYRRALVGALRGATEQSRNDLCVSLGISRKSVDRAVSEINRGLYVDEMVAINRLVSRWMR